MSRRRRCGSDAGSATVEFVGGLLVLAVVAVAVIQVAVYVYARQVVSSAAAARARRAAAVDAGPADGVAAARGALAGGLGRLGRGLSVQGSGDGETVEVVVTGTVPGLGLVPDLPVTARSRARDEDAVLPGGLP